MTYKMGCGLYLPKRYILVFLGHSGFFMIYALRVNLSVAVVAMVNSSYTHADEARQSECGGAVANASVYRKDKIGEFNWDQKQQGIILGAFFYGYLFTQILGGWLASKYGGKNIFGFGVLCTSLLTLLTPIAARTSIYLLVTLRVLEGISEGMTSAAMLTIIARWAVPKERSRMLAFAHAGVQVGVIIALPVTGLLANSDFLGGWPSTFYVFGTLGILWFLAWNKYVYNSPNDHPFISDEERKYITDALGNGYPSKKAIKVPWRKILTSMHVWAIIVASFADSWMFDLMLTGLPSYFKQVLNVRLDENGFLSALPYIGAFLMKLVSSSFADYLITNWLSVIQTRRLMEITGVLVVSLSLFPVGLAGCNQISLPVGFVVLAEAFSTFAISGYHINAVDISPRFAGVIFSIANTIASLAGSFCPLITGYITNQNPTRENYRKVFLLAAGIYMAGGIFFSCFASGEQQQWNNIEDESDEIGGNSNEAMEMDIDTNKSQETDNIVSPV